MDRVTDFESGGWGFDSLWGRCNISDGLHPTGDVPGRNVKIRVFHVSQIKKDRIKNVCGLFCLATGGIHLSDNDKSMKRFSNAGFL